MKAFLYSMLATSILLAGCVTTTRKAPSKTILLSDGWRFFKGKCDGAWKTDVDTSDWQTVKVPHTWNTDLINGKTYYLGASWYRLKFTVTPKMASKRLFLKFEGVGTVAEVYVNGEKVGEHRGGYSAFCLEITGKTHVGENLLAVKADNSFNNDITPVANRLFTRFGGIYRPVKLIVKNKLCVTPLDYASPGVYLKQKNVSEKRADLDVIAKISNGRSGAANCVVKTTIRDAAGKIVDSFSTRDEIPPGKTKSAALSGSLGNPHLWDGKKDPYLYTATIELFSEGELLDSVVQPLGFRYFRLDPKRGFFLNGKHIDLHGVCRHQEWEKEGAALSDAQHRHDIDDIRDIGANAVRFAHYEQADIMYSLCDEYGLVAWAEIPVTPKYQHGNPKYFENCEQQLVELIRQRFNHPSICFWGLYNEVDLPLQDVKKLYALAKREDPSRLVVAASSRSLRERHGVTDAIAWNRYPFWYMKTEISKFVDSIHKKRPKLIVGISEYGAGGCVGQHALYPKKPRPVHGRFFPEEYQALVHEKVWRDIKDRNDIWCKFIWNMFDFSWPPSKRGDRIHMNHKGMITYDRKIKKDVYFFYKANWSDAPVLYITSRRFTQRESPETYVKIYSNAPEVTLYVNGKKIGVQKPNDLKIVQWNGVTLEKGNNIIEAKALVNGKTLTDKCEWRY